jgi:hypothetical protein
MADYYTKYYKSLEGATILKFVEMRGEAEYADGFPVFLVRFANGLESEIEISRDPEGNGGGFIFGLPRPA